MHSHFYLLGMVALRVSPPLFLSLPKASSDDNPVETIFSNIRQMILDSPISHVTPCRYFS
jgi:hypothetical protein